MLERQIVCGDAYAFQGDERDVMFLSMVAAPNAKIGALAKEEDKRRFNVAASRARDQVWLIHSVRLEDLSETDMRRALLEYYLDPQVEHLEELEERDWSVVDYPFESKFEQDVYLELRRRGFRVAPQVKVAGYRIDLVVEGADGRLAVECDGDEWHGPDRWATDMARQRQLERCGWRFVRIRGSEFYRDREAALDRLWKALDSRGIKPGGYANFDRWKIREAPITGPDRDEAGVGKTDELDAPATGEDLVVDQEPETVEDPPVRQAGRVGTDVETEEPDLQANAGHATTSQPRVDDVPVATPTQWSNEQPPTDQIEESTQPPAPAGSAGKDDLEPVIPGDVSSPVPPWATLGTRVLHPVRGPGRITAVANVHAEAYDPSQPIVRIRFDDGPIVEYTESELRQAEIWLAVSARPAAPLPPSQPSRQQAETAQPPPGREDTAPSETRTRHGVALRPYVTWSVTGAPDPRQASYQELSEWILGIVEVEGPVTADRAYTLLVRSSGGVRVTTNVRKALNRAIHRMKDQLDINSHPSPATNWPQRVLHLRGSAPVVVRERGPRELYEIPLTELAAVFADLRHRRQLSSDEGLMRDVLDIYDLRRLTAKTRAYLLAATRLIET